MAMKYEGRRSPFWEADCYLQKAQDVISRSLHELASITIKDDSKQTIFLRQHRQLSSNLRSSATVYRKNSLPAICVSEHDIANFVQSFSSSDDQPGAEYYLSSRRKRFTRRQRRNLTDEIFRERTSKSTSALNKVHRLESTSSSDNDNINERRKRSAQLTKTKKRDQSTSPHGAIKSTETTSLSLRRNYANSSLITRSTTEICCKSTLTQLPTPIEPADIFRKFKGPAARKAHRRALRCKLNSFANNEFETKAESQTKLDIHADNNTQFKKNTLVQRSVSVRDLNGTMIDFTNQDSVTRWTSQILAEIDSLSSSSFDLTGPSALQSSSFIIPATFATTTVITDSDIVHPSESEYDYLKQNMQPPPGNNSDISFKMGTMNSTISAQSYCNEPQTSLLAHYRTQKIASESIPNHFIKFQKRNSFKKNIWHQSTEIPEVSCTVHIVLTARPSNRRKQSAHAIVISAPKAAEGLEKLHFLSPKFSNNNRGPILQNRSSHKNGSGSNESSRLWRFLSRKRYSSLKKYLKLHQKDIKIDRHSSRVPKSAYGQLSDYAAANGIEWRSNINSVNSNGYVGSRTYSSVESIDLVKKSDIDDKLKTKRIQPVAETSSPLTIWKRKVSCVIVVFNYDVLSS
ncbi:Suppressor of silencing [Dirofilaria immitis]